MFQAFQRGEHTSSQGQADLREEQRWQAPHPKTEPQARWQKAVEPLEMRRGRAIASPPIPLLDRDQPAGDQPDSQPVDDANAEVGPQSAYADLQAVEDMYANAPEHDT